MKIPKNKILKLENNMTQEPKPIEAYKAVDITNLVAIAKNALMLLEDFQTDMNNPVDSEVGTLKQRLDEMLKDTFVNRFITLDDDFDTDTVDTIMDNSAPFVKEEDEVLATTRGGIINITGRLAEYQANIQMAEIGTVELLADMERSELAEKDFWLNKAIRTDIMTIRESLVPFLADTQRTRS